MNKYKEIIGFFEQKLKEFKELQRNQEEREEFEQEMRQCITKIEKDVEEIKKSIIG
jgi:hypothetical protein